MGNDGYTSFTVLCLILFSSSLLIWASSFTIRSSRTFGSLEERVAEDEKLYNDIGTIIDVLLKEKEADSKYDEVWNFVDVLSDDKYDYSITELSSALNPNFNDLDLWKKTDLKDQVVSSSALDQWNSDRNIHFTSSEEDLYEVFPEESWENIHTLYNFLNVQASSDDVIIGYLSQNGYSEAESQSIANKISSYKSNNETISQSELNDLIHREDKPYSYFLTGYPQINVNLCDEQVLDAILNYPWLGQPLNNAHIIKNNIINTRSHSEIDNDSLVSLLDCDNEIRKELLKYLGTTSWFWQITIENNKSIHTYILCRIPPIEEELFPDSIQIVSTHREYKG